MEFRVLGPFEVVDQGVSIKLARLPRLVLAVLLLRRGTAVSVEALAESVWDGAAPASAASLLRLYVSQIRRVLPAGRLRTHRAGYMLSLSNDGLDADRFESFLTDGRRALEEGNLSLARVLHARALALWRGDALGDLRAHAFARDEAARLDELRLICVEGGFEAELRLGQHEHVVAELDRHVAAFHLRERPRSQLMLALYRSGRQADALASYRAGRAALHDELGLEPSAELRELERRMLAHDPTLEAQAEPATALPAVAPPTTRTIGREADLAQLRDRLMAPDLRLLTLVGPGGVGKTRLAVELAHTLGPDLADGAVVVDLAPLSDPTQIVPSIGRALGLRETSTARWEDLLSEWLSGRELLLVLDNFEHLIEGAASVADVLALRERLTVLVTSRQPLRITAEHVFEVQPLDHEAAVELLAERASAAGATVAAGRGDFVEVCQLLDGLPLAIELAAPWLRTLTAPELLRLLDTQLDVLERGARDGPARHRTMRSAIDWGFELLDRPTQHLLGRLSLFNGTFTTDAALEIGGTDAAVDQLARLVEASIVRSADGRHGLLEVVREYAQDLPSADQQGRELHALHFLRLAEAAEDQLIGPTQAVWLERLEAEHDNLRTALDWFSEHETSQELRLATALSRFWYVRGYLSEGLARLRHAAATANHGDDPLVAQAFRSASAIAVLRGEYPLARSLAEQALTRYRRLNDDAGAARALSNLGAILHAQGELELAGSSLDDCIEAAQTVGDNRLIALARNNRGDVALSQGQLDIAAEQFEESLALLRAINDVANVARALYNLGVVAVEQGKHRSARKNLGESLEISSRINDREDIAWCLIALAALAASDGAQHEAASMLGYTTVLLKRIGATMKPFEQHLFDRTRERLRTAFGDEQLGTLLASASTLPHAEALRLGHSIARA